MSADSSVAETDTLHWRAAHGGAPTLVKTLGIEIAEAGPDGCVLTMDVRPEHLQPMGILHGGVHCTLVETAASVAGAAWFGTRGHVVGAANHTNFLRPCTEGRITATATPIHRGRSQQLWLVEITDEAKRLLARGEVRLANQAASGS
jgi:uncharacterized protein (TIGR00369 family)